MRSRPSGSGSGPKPIFRWFMAMPQTPVIDLRKDLVATDGRAHRRHQAGSEMGRQTHHRGAGSAFWTDRTEVRRKGPQNGARRKLTLRYPPLTCTFTNAKNVPSDVELPSASNPTESLLMIGIGR